MYTDSVIWLVCLAVVIIVAVVIILRRDNHRKNPPVKSSDNPIGSTTYKTPLAEVHKGFLTIPKSGDMLIGIVNSSGKEVDGTIVINRSGEQKDIFAKSAILPLAIRRVPTVFFCPAEKLNTAIYAVFGERQRAP